MAIISFSTIFDLTLSPKQFVFDDTSDYAGQSILVADVNGCFKITSPSGTVIYNNTDFSNVGCDIRVAISTTNQTIIQLPLGLNGLPEPGVYTIIYTVFNSDASEYYTVTNVYTYAYIRPEVLISQTVHCISPLFTSSDITTYAVNGIIPIIERVHTIDYPFGTPGEGNPTIGTEAVITVSTFYNGTQTTEIESDLEYIFSDGLIIVDYVTGVQEVLVDCVDTCKIYCCIRSIEQQMMQAATTNTSTYATLTSLFSQIMGLVGMVQLAIRCNKSADISGYLTAIKLLAHCTDDCGCSGDAPSQVMGLGGLVNNVVVESTGSPLTVTPVTIGNTTTYYISFDAALLTKLNTLYNTVVAAGTGVTVTDSTTGYVTTYTVNVDNSVTATVDTTSAAFNEAEEENINDDVTIGSGVLDAGNYHLNIHIEDFDMIYMAEQPEGSGIFELKVQLNSDPPIVVWKKGIAGLITHITDLIDADVYLTVASDTTTITILGVLIADMGELANVSATLGEGTVLIWDNAF